MRGCGRLRHRSHPLFYDQAEALNENWTDEPDRRPLRHVTTLGENAGVATCSSKVMHSGIGRVWAQSVTHCRATSWSIVVRHHGANTGIRIPTNASALRKCSAGRLLGPGRPSIGLFLHGSGLLRGKRLLRGSGGLLLATGLLRGSGLLLGNGLLLGSGRSGPI